MAIVSVYFNAIRGLSIKRFIEAYPHLTILKDGVRVPRDPENPTITKFKRQFLDIVDPKDFYIFIYTPNQRGEFENLCEQYGLDRYVHYRAPHAAVNSNYPEVGRRLFLCIFHFPNGYSHE